MKPAALAVALANLVSLTPPQPTFIWGPPGIGKSQIALQVARAYASNGSKRQSDYFIDLRLVNRDITDLRGILTLDDKKRKAVWYTPDELPTRGKGVILLDEFPQALPLMQNTASQLILDRRIGEYLVPDGWAIIAAGNRDTDRAATNKMPSHLANRFTHLTLEIDYEDWARWAMGNGISPMIIAFLGWRPALLHVFDPALKSFPTPRSWEFVSRIIDAGINDSVMLEVVSGTVGEAAAKEFIGFVRVFKQLPDYDHIVKKPSDAIVPDNPAAGYAAATMLGTRAQQQHATAIGKYVGRMDKEFQLLTWTTMTKHNPEMAETSSYIKWASENNAMLLNRAGV